MITKKYSGIPGYLFTGLIALAFAFIACFYLVRNNQSYNGAEPAMVLEEFITEPLAPVVPGLWQIAY